MSSIVMVTDDEEKGVQGMRKLKNGRYVPVFFAPSGIERMPETALRFDDVILLSYPKSGCHWMWENLRFIVAGEITKDDVEKRSYFMDRHEFGTFDSMPSPRILNNHAFFDDQPRDLINGKVKVVFVYRNPKDIAVSYFHHRLNFPDISFKGKFSSFLKLFVEGKLYCDYFNYMKTWENALIEHPEIPCLIVSYEDMLRKPLDERRRMAQFLGKDRDDTFLQAVAEATTIDKMREMKSSSSIKGKDGDAVMYRKGQIGDWKNHFTVSESEWFDECIKEKLGDLKLFDFIYE